VLATVPWLGVPTFYESILYLVCHWAVLALSWNILSGYSGYFSFGHGAFFGIGMYTTAVFSGKLNWPFLATLPLAALIPAVLALGLGLRRVPGAGRARRAVRAAHAGRHLRGGHHHPEHAHRRRAGRLPQRGGHPEDRPPRRRPST
jgi:hypothetical protein